MNRRPSQYVLENPEETLLSFHLLAAGHPVLKWFYDRNQREKQGFHRCF